MFIHHNQSSVELLKSIWRNNLFIKEINSIQIFIKAKKIILIHIVINEKIKEVI